MKRIVQKVRNYAIAVDFGTALLLAYSILG